MNNTTAMPHQGRNVKRIREILGIKQDALAIDLGLSQQAISQLEQRETLDAPTLEKVAKVLGVSTEAIKSFSEEATVNFISNTFTSNDTSIGSIAHQYNFNPIEKIVELYEALVKSEKDKVAMLERLLDKK
jgi:transcriptional regulator with XRE-family HTH domain